MSTASAPAPIVGATSGGLRVVSETIPGVRSVAIGVWIGVGSRFERPEEAGISHFLEHMLFKGTPTLSPEEIAQAFDALGGEVNAATGKDYTVLYCRVLDELLDQAMPLLTDMLQRPTFLDLDQEREVVLEEIAMYEDDPQDQIHDLASLAVFPDQALGRPVIGTAEVIGSVPEAGVRAYHRDHYTAPNMVVAAAGNVAHERVLELSERLLGGLSTASGEGAYEPARAGRPTLVLKEKTTEQYHLCLGGPGPVAQRPAPARPVGARHGPRRVDEQPPVPGGAREARPGLLGRLLRRRLRGRRAGGRLPRHARGQPRDGVRRDRRRSCAASATSRCPPPSCAGRRTT